jgi:uncharacterized protein YbjT (DUF2867 family)
MPDNTALIAGASGLVGSHLLPLLLESYDRVLSIGRRKLELTHPRLEQCVVDFEQLPDLGASADVFCALGTTVRKAGSQAATRLVDHDYPLNLARQVAAAGSRQFLLVSSVGADRRSTNFYLRTKGELEDALAALPFRSLHIFHPSFLIGKRAEARPGEKIGIAIATMLAPLLIGGLRKYRAVSAAAVADAMLAAARRAEPGRHFYSYDQF